MPIANNPADLAVATQADILGLDSEQLRDAFQVLNSPALRQMSQATN